MDEELLEIVRAEKARIADMGASNAYQWTSAEHVYELGKQLEQFEPFKHLAKRWLRLPLGAGRTGSQLAGRWVWLRLLGNMAPEAIIAFAKESIVSNRYEALEVRAIKGITGSGFSLGRPDLTRSAKSRRGNRSCFPPDRPSFGITAFPLSPSITKRCVRSERFRHCFRRRLNGVLGC